MKWCIGEGYFFSLRYNDNEDRKIFYYQLGILFYKIVFIESL